MKKPQQGEKKVRKPQGEENSFLVFKCATTFTVCAPARLKIIVQILTST